MNNDLKNDIYTLPDILLDKLKLSLNNLTPGDSGYDRCKKIVGDGNVNYSQAKKIKHELENDLEDNSYEVIGGDDMLDFINSSLGDRRQRVHKSKKIRQNTISFC